MHACTDKLLVNLLTSNSELATNCLQRNMKEIQELMLEMDDGLKVS